MIPTCERGNRTATPGCPCTYCRAVFEERGRQAENFQRLLESGMLDRYLTGGPRP